MECFGLSAYGDDTRSGTYSIADQVACFSKAISDGDARYLDIASLYDGSFLNGKTVRAVFYVLRRRTRARAGGI